MITYFFSLGKTKKEKKANRQKKKSATTTTVENNNNKKTNKQGKRIPLRGFLLRRYAVTRVLLTTAYHLSE